MDHRLAEPLRKAAAISVAAAAVADMVPAPPNVHSLQHFHRTHSVYQELMNRDMNPCLRLDPTTSSLAAAILGSAHNLKSPFGPNHQFIGDAHASPYIRHPFELLPSLYPSPEQRTVPTPILPNPRKRSHHNEDSIDIPSKSQLMCRSTAARLTESWTCTCPHVLSDDDMMNERSLCRSRGSPNSSINSPNRSNSSPSGDMTNSHPNHLRTCSMNSVAPFECAKSFIRRRNARERERVRCVNAGYESLRRHLPLSVLPDRRLAKVEILRGAINYIHALKDLLEK